MRWVGSLLLFCNRRLRNGDKEFQLLSWHFFWWIYIERLRFIDLRLNRVWQLVDLGLLREIWPPRIRKLWWFLCVFWGFKVLKLGKSLPRCLPSGTRSISSENLDLWGWGKRNFLDTISTNDFFLLFYLNFFLPHDAIIFHASLYNTFLHLWDRLDGFYKVIFHSLVILVLCVGDIGGVSHVVRCD